MESNIDVQRQGGDFFMAEAKDGEFMDSTTLTSEDKISMCLKLLKEVHSLSCKKDMSVWYPIYKKTEEFIDMTCDRGSEVFGMKHIVFESCCRNHISRKPTSNNSRKSLYFMKNKMTSLVKIGASHNPRKRQNQLKGMNAGDLDILCVVDGAGKYEKILHKRFDEDRVNGEWFRASEDLLILVALAKQNGVSALS